MASVPGRCDRRDQLRGDTVKNCDQRWHFYYDRIVDVWNGLDDKIVGAETVDILKERIDNANKHSKNKKQ